MNISGAGNSAAITINAGGTVDAANGTGTRGVFVSTGGVVPSLLVDGTLNGGSNPGIEFTDGGGDGTASTIENNGTIGSAIASTIILRGGYNGDVAITNNSLITSIRNGIFVEASATSGGSIINNGGGIIEGSNRGVNLTAESGTYTITNDGTIRGIAASGTSEEGVRITGTGGTANVTNTGTISSVVDDAFFSDGAHTTNLTNSGLITTDSNFRALFFEPNSGGSVINTGTIDGHVEITPSNGVAISYTQTAGTTGSGFTDEYLSGGTNTATFSGGAINLGLIRHGNVEDGEVLTLSGGLTYTQTPAIDGWETAIIATTTPYVAAARGATTRTGGAANVDVSAVTLQIDTEVQVNGTPLLGPGDHTVGMTVDMSGGGKLNFQDGATDDNWIFGNGTGGGTNDVGVINGGTVAMDMASLGAACTTDLIATDSAAGTLTHTGAITLDLATSGATTPTTTAGFCMFADQGNDGAQSFATLTAGTTPTDVSTVYTLGTNPFDTNGIDYYVIEDADGNAALAWVGKVGVVVSETAVTTAEDGTTDTFTVVLSGPPSADVVVTPTSDDTDEATVSGALTFTSANWDTPQTVTVTGIDEDIDDGDASYAITLAVTSTDAAYNGVSPEDTGGTALPSDQVTGTNTDDDTNGITVSAISSPTILEDGATSATFTVVLDSEPTADVEIPVTISDATQATLDVATLTFTAADWDTAQTVTVTAIDDLVEDGDSALTIDVGAATSTDANYGGVDSSDDPAVTVTDNDTAGVTVTPTSGLVVEESGTTDTFDVVLTSSPASGLTVEIPITSADTSSATVDLASLTFDDTNWNVPQTVTVTGVDDIVPDGDQVFMIELGTVITTDTSYTGMDPDDVEVTVLDDDVAGDAGATLSSAEQSRSALGMLTSTHDHVAYRLGSSGQFQDEFLNSLTLGRDRAAAGGSGLLGWYNLGVSATTLSGDAAGEGTYAYALAGRDLRQSDSSLFGILYGVEQGDWTYDAESDVTKTGLSFGVYNGQKLGTNLTLSTYLTYTRLMNSLTSTSGATAEMDSDRLIGSIQLSGGNELASGTSIRPYISAQYAYEDLPAYTYSDGLALESASVSLGEYAAGLEITTPFNPVTGQFFGGFAVSQTFGIGEVTLSDGSVISDQDEVTGSANIGWVSNGGTDSVGRIELTIDGLGDDNREETILDAHLERSF